MGDELSLTNEEIAGLGNRLDASGDLTDRDREVLHGLFALAGLSLGSARPVEELDQDEVGGFALPTPGPGLGGADAASSFQWGLDQADAGKGSGGGKGGGGSHIYLKYEFRQVFVSS